MHILIPLSIRPHFWLLFSVVFCTTVCGTYAQTGTVYGPLSAKKFYSVSLSSYAEGRITVYEVNGRRVNRGIYQKYESAWKNMETCCPCLLKVYDENDLLLKEYAACTDCVVGVYREFYEDGKLKLEGHYKENPSRNWNNIWARGYCSVPHGEFIYYNTDGKLSHKEFWEAGSFVKQSPESGRTEIWKVDLLLDGKPVADKAITVDDISRLQVQPWFKNSSRDGMELKVLFRVQNPVNYNKKSERSLNPDALGGIRFEDMLGEAGITDKKAEVRLEVYGNGSLLGNFYLNINY